MKTNIMFLVESMDTNITHIRSVDFYVIDHVTRFSLKFRVKKKTLSNTRLSII